jgi:hypothetical protein
MEGYAARCRAKWLWEAHADPSKVELYRHWYLKGTSKRSKGSGRSSIPRGVRPVVSKYDVWSDPLVSESEARRPRRMRTRNRDTTRASRP